MNTRIRTPDQRLRVFISSTMQELAAERAAVRSSIESMHLHPVLFEMGARPHPPRDLYRAYLEQSDIFVGIYWQNYGWTAPDMEISGLEDEFVLAGSMPRLIYVREPAPERDPKLTELLDRIAKSGVSYRPFATPDELASYVSEDLAVLLTERFQTESPETQVVGSGFRTFLPAIANTFVGRERELADLEELLTAGEQRLISLTGPGGVGKSRLALELAHRTRSHFEDGAHVVALETVKVPDEVPSRIASSLNLIAQYGTVSPMELVKRALSRRDLLLVLDNFEQVLPAGPHVADLIAECPGIRVVVTSRSLLRLRGEHEYPVDPLAVPEEGETTTTAAMRLFLERARPSPVLDDPEQIEAIAEISRRLEGIPLALELAAARTSILTPLAIVERLDDLFGLLKTRQRDLPERLRTMHAAIAWSAELLSPEEQTLFRRLAVFSGGFNLETVAAICLPDDDLDVIDRMQTLVEVNLVRQFVRRGQPRFRLYVPIREYAIEMLEAAGETDRFRDRHADHFLEIAVQAHSAIRSPKQTEIFDRLDEEDPNIRSALQRLLDNGRADLVSRAGWVLWYFWWGRGRLQEGFNLMTLVVDSGDVGGRDLARALSLQGALSMFMGDYGRSVESLTTSLVEMRAVGDYEGTGYSETALGMVAALVEGPEQMMARLNEAIEVFRSIDDEWALIMPLTAMGWMAVALGIRDIPEENFREAMEIGNRRGGVLERYMAIGSYGWWLLPSDRRRAADLIKQAIVAFAEGDVRYGVAHEMGGVAELAILQKDYAGATRLYAAAAMIRTDIGAPLLPAFEQGRSLKIGELKEALTEDGFEREYARGLALPYAEAVAEAQAVCDRSLATPAT